MKKGSIIIDLSIDQGGCIETSRLTTLEHPVYTEEGVIHYCVPNITSGVSRTSTKVLANLVTPYLIKIGEIGIEKTLKSEKDLARGVYIYKGVIAKRKIGERFNLEYKEII
jgi:alanine dehydrogenase